MVGAWLAMQGKNCEGHNGNVVKDQWKRRTSSEMARSRKEPGLSIQANQSRLKAGAVSMQPCPVCKRKAEWRFKEGWSALACAVWFAGTCEGDPLQIAPPSVGNIRPLNLEIEEDKRYAHWVRTRLRELWPLERSA